MQSKILRRTLLRAVRRKLFVNSYVDDNDDDLSQPWSRNQPQASSTPCIDDEANNKWGSDVFFSSSSDDNDDSLCVNTGGYYVYRVCQTQNPENVSYSTDNDANRSVSSQYTPQVSGGSSDSGGSLGVRSLRCRNNANDGSTSRTSSSSSSSNSGRRVSITASSDEENLHSDSVSGGTTYSDNSMHTDDDDDRQGAYSVNDSDESSVENEYTASVRGPDFRFAIVEERNHYVRSFRVNGVHIIIRALHIIMPASENFDSILWLELVIRRIHGYLVSMASDSDLIGVTINSENFAHGSAGIF
ncbi:hypothetical protein TSAR_001986 [Trichomalopsis sarcophagae]|uniref:Uncharacterized protein n=1 Tax=Trichomalopsis sarcophagae TaxID=543379 RepID=A0A232ELB0_9HYME|nr:hypothetical protein TSAR_001986 [Trichomalopsis sarcophagae]